MIWAIVQIVFLMAGGIKLANFKRGQCRYRFIFSLFASCWAGVCFALSMAIILKWPQAVDQSSALTAVLAGVSCALIFWCHGNVADLYRKLGALVNQLVL